MTLRHRLASLERRHDRYLTGVCDHGVDIVEVEEPERPAPTCDHCGRQPFQIVLREDESGRAWSGKARDRDDEATYHRKDTP